MTSLYIGLMSGTSMDAIDAALVDFSAPQPQLIATHSLPMPPALYQQLQKVLQPSDNELNEIGQLDRKLADLFAQTVNELLAKTNYQAKHIHAIGSHGQTIRHMPNLGHAFSWQITDPNSLACQTGIDVIADFRRKDIALGGQGAPLVPAFHHAQFAEINKERIIVNIGGIANLTYLNGNETQVLGFDTGPGNCLLDAWVQLHQQQPYDKDGQWAASGTVHPEFVAHLLNDLYFQQAHPKSTGKEYFNLSWLQTKLSAGFDGLASEDVQASLVALTAQSIANDINKLTKQGEIYLCGGGAYNSELIQQLTSALPQFTIQSTQVLGVDPQWVESMAFAWLAMRHQHQLTGNLPAVTGASRAAILGARYFAN